MEIWWETKTHVNEQEPSWSKQDRAWVAGGDAIYSNLFDCQVWQWTDTSWKIHLPGLEVYGIGPDHPAKRNGALCPMLPPSCDFFGSAGKRPWKASIGSEGGGIPPLMGMKWRGTHISSNHLFLGVPMSTRSSDEVTVPLPHRYMRALSRTTR